MTGAPRGSNALARACCVATKHSATTRLDDDEISAATEILWTGGGKPARHRSWTTDTRRRWQHRAGRRRDVRVRRTSSNARHAASVALRGVVRRNAEPRWAEASVRALRRRKRRSRCLASSDWSREVRLEDDSGDDVLRDGSHGRGAHRWTSEEGVVSYQTPSSASRRRRRDDDDERQRDKTPTRRTPLTSDANASRSTTRTAPTPAPSSAGAVRASSRGRSRTGHGRARGRHPAARCYRRRRERRCFQPDAPGTLRAAAMGHHRVRSTCRRFSSARGRQGSREGARGREEHGWRHRRRSRSRSDARRRVVVRRFCPVCVAAHPSRARRGTSRGAAARSRNDEARGGVTAAAESRSIGCERCATHMERRRRERFAATEDERERMIGAETATDARARARARRASRRRLRRRVYGRAPHTRLVPATTHLWRLLCFVGVFAEGVSLSSLAFAANTAPWWGRTVASVGRALAFQLDAPGHVHSARRARRVRRRRGWPPPMVPIRVSPATEPGTASTRRATTPRDVTRRRARTRRFGQPRTRRQSRRKKRSSVTVFAYKRETVCDERDE